MQKEIPFPEALQPEELKLLLTEGVDLAIVDVREDWEIKICSFSGSINLPLRNLVQNLHCIPEDRPIVTICHHGVRSRQAAVLLKENGFKSVANLARGVDGWSREVDPAMAIYE